MVAWRQSAIRSSMHGRKKGAEAYATGQARVATQGNMMGCEREDTQISRRRPRTGRGRRRAPLGEPGAQLLTLVAAAHQVIQLVWCVLRVHDVCVRVRTREAPCRYACHACSLQKMPTHTKAQPPATPNDCRRAGASARSLSLWRRHIVDPEARGEVSIVRVTLLCANGIELRVGCRRLA